MTEMLSLIGHGVQDTDKPYGNTSTKKRRRFIHVRFTGIIPKKEKQPTIYAVNNHSSMETV